MGSGFVDPVNPTPTEIRQWASAPSALEPMQDWDLILESDARDELYLELAASEVPNSTYFLHILYLIVGDAYRPDLDAEGSDRVEDQQRAEAITLQARASGVPGLLRLAERAELLAQDPSLFDTEAWCGGGLAYERAT